MEECKPLYSGSKQHPQKVQVQEEPLIISMHTAAVPGKLPNAIKMVKKGDAKAANRAAESAVKATAESSTGGAPEDADDAALLDLAKAWEDEVILGATETVNASLSAAGAGAGVGAETAPMQA